MKTCYQFRKTPIIEIFEFKRFPRSKPLLRPIKLIYTIFLFFLSNSGNNGNRFLIIQNEYFKSKSHKKTVESLFKSIRKWERKNTNKYKVWLGEGGWKWVAPSGATSFSSWEYNCTFQSHDWKKGTSGDKIEKSPSGGVLTIKWSFWMVFGAFPIILMSAHHNSIEMVDELFYK